MGVVKRGLSKRRRRLGWVELDWAGLLNRAEKWKIGVFGDLVWSSNVILLPQRSSSAFGKKEGKGWV